MSRKITFDELVARREQRENDKLKVGMLTIPGTGVGLEARMPPQKAVLELYGRAGQRQGHSGGAALRQPRPVCVLSPAAGAGPAEGTGRGRKSHGYLDVLFTPVEQDQLGGDALRFLGLLPPLPDKTKPAGSDGEPAADPGLETVKN